MRHIVLFEPDASGHRMVFVRYIVEAMARHGGVRATLVTTERGKTGFERLTIDDRAHRLVTMHVIGEPDAGGKRLPLPRKLSMQAEQTRLLRAALQSLGSDAAVDHVLIPFIDDYCLLPALWRTATFGTIPFSGIAIRPRFHLKKSGADVPNRPADWVERLAYRRLLSAPSFKTLFSIDPYLEQRLDTPRVVTVCDPADIAGNIADPAWLPVAEEAVVLLVYGYIDSRKAIDRLLRLVADPAMPKSLVVALVGEQDRQLRPVMESALAVSLRAEHRLVEVNRRVDDHEEASAFARADIVWAYHPGNYCSSGAMVRAGQMSRPLLTTQEGLVGHVTRLEHSGLTAPEDDDDALLGQLKRLAQDRDLRNRLGHAGKRRFGADTGIVFGDRIVQRVIATVSGTSAESP